MGSHNQIPRGTAADFLGCGRGCFSFFAAEGGDEGTTLIRGVLTQFRCAAWREGAALLYLGRPLTLALFAARRQTIAADLLHLTVLHPNPGDEEQIGAFVGRWLREQALALLTSRVVHFASRVAASTPTVKLSNARTQWGTCNHKGEIRLNWRLIQLPPRIADYVVAHEVAHLIELNHSPRFWALVEALLPGHADARRELDVLTPLLG